MPNDDDGPDKATDSERSTATPTDDAPPAPLITVEVSRETAREAARLADEYGIAMEDALVRLTAFDYPADALDGTIAEAECNCGP